MDQVRDEHYLVGRRLHNLDEPVLTAGVRRSGPSSSLYSSTQVRPADLPVPLQQPAASSSDNNAFADSSPEVINKEEEVKEVFGKPGTISEDVGIGSSSNSSSSAVPTAGVDRRVGEE
jgi:hypothetical protein